MVIIDVSLMYKQIRLENKSFFRISFCNYILLQIDNPINYLLLHNKKPQSLTIKNCGFKKDCFVTLTRNPQ